MQNVPLTLSPFHPGESVISLVEHPPEIKPGTMAKIVSPWFGSLCAVQLPDGMIHRWFAWFELRTESMLPSSYATVISTEGHGHPPHIKPGTRVKIVRCRPNTTFYDVTLSNGEYHRWLAEFELARPIIH